jgi:hypothetical protein
METHETAKPATFGYNQVQAGLTAALDSTDHPGRVRGRIQHIRRLQLAPKSGRGRVIRYNFDWIARWHLALLLSMRLGYDPTEAVAFIQKNWGRASRDPDTAFHRGEAMLADIVAVARTARTKDEHVILTLDHRNSPELPTFGYVQVRGLGSFTSWLSDQADVITIFDLTAILKRLDRELAAAAASVV